MALYYFTDLTILIFTLKVSKSNSLTPSPESVSCTLKSGVEVLLGSPTEIETKEMIVTRYLEAHPGTITYLNVRVVTNPAVRLIDSENVQPGTGVLSEGTGA